MINARNALLLFVALAPALASAQSFPAAPQGPDECALSRAPRDVIDYAHARASLEAEIQAKYRTQALPARPGSKVPSLALRQQKMQAELKAVDGRLAKRFPKAAVDHYKAYLARCGERAFHD